MVTFNTKLPLDCTEVRFIHTKFTHNNICSCAILCIIE